MLVYLIFLPVIIVSILLIAGKTSWSTSIIIRVLVGKKKIALYDMGKIDKFLGGLGLLVCFMMISSDFVTIIPLRIGMVILQFIITILGLIYVFTCCKKK